MISTQLFIVQKTAQAILALERARMRAQREPTLLALALVVGRVQVNHLVRPLPSVRAAMVRLRSETERHAAQLAAELVARYEADSCSERSAQELRETFRACSGIFPREAAVLRRVLEAKGVGADGGQSARPQS
jgi:hypothetical protein